MALWLAGKGTTVAWQERQSGNPSTVCGTGDADGVPDTGVPSGAGDAA